MQLKPVLGPFQLTFYSVGVIVGAGVYSVIGPAAGVAQHALWLSFVVSAFVALLTAISYAEMATAFPHAGAEYIYVRHAWPGADWLAFGVGAVILIGGAATAATVAVAFGGYLRVFTDWPVAFSALALLAACTAFNIWGLRESSWVNVVFTSIEIAGLALVVAVAFFADARPAQSPAPLTEPAVLAGAALLFFVYLGFENIANLSEEVRNPARDLPFALFVSLAVTTVLYVAVSFAALALATPAELAASQAPLAMVVQKAWPGADKLLGAIALFATANTVLITLIAMSRLAFSMARDREISGVFAKLLHVRQTPWTAALLMFAMAAVLLPTGSVKFLAEISSFAALVAFFAVNAALIALRYRMPARTRPFRVPFAIGKLPVLPVLALASIVLLLIHFDWQIHVAGVAALALSALAYAARQWSRSRGR